MDYAEESLRLHYAWKGKLEITPRAAVDSKDALSLAYTPGVAQPCLEIQKNPHKSYELTRRWNTVAVVTDGSAVLGLGDIGPEAGMPVMEGKCVLFKAFGDVDAIPLCIRSLLRSRMWQNKMSAFLPIRPRPHQSGPCASGHRNLCRQNTRSVPDSLRSLSQARSDGIHTDPGNSFPH